MLKHRDLSRKIIKAFYEVYNELGSGFLESVYENAFSILLKEYNFKVERQIAVDVFFKGDIVGEFKADLLIESKILVELKSVAFMLPEHEAQIINYLKATDVDVGLLMNFGTQPQFKRFIFDRKRKIRRYP